MFLSIRASCYLDPMLRAEDMKMSTADAMLCCRWLVAARSSECSHLPRHRPAIAPCTTPWPSPPVHLSSLPAGEYQGDRVHPLVRNACSSYCCSSVVSSSWVWSAHETTHPRSPVPRCLLVARPGAGCPNGRPYLPLHRDTVWRANRGGVAGPGVQLQTKVHTRVCNQGEGPSLLGPSRG